MAKYLANSEDKIPKGIYPTDAKTRALVDEYLAYQHTTVRRQGIQMFVNHVRI